MSNSLTGDYEAVLEVAIRQINGVLGTLHQNAEPQRVPPSPPVAEFRVVPFPFPTPPALQTPHSLTTRIAERIWRPPVDFPRYRGKHRQVPVRHRPGGQHIQGQGLV
jgi:hypothetical protein